MVIVSIDEKGHDFYNFDILHAWDLFNPLPIIGIEFLRIGEIRKNSMSISTTVYLLLKWT